MERFDVDVYLVNGEVEHYRNVVRLTIHDGALNLQGQYTAYEREHLASYPMTSVLKWKILRP